MCYDQNSGLITLSTVNCASPRTDGMRERETPCFVTHKTWTMFDRGKFSKKKNALIYAGSFCGIDCT